MNTISTPQNKEGCLVVDDDRGVLQIVGQVLEAGGQRVLRAETVAEARLLVQGRRIRMSIIDLNIREASGLTLADELIARQRDLGVLMMSGALTPEVVRQALQLGVRACLSKPLELDSLRRAIAAVLAAPLGGDPATNQGGTMPWASTPEFPKPSEPTDGPSLRS